MDAKALRVSDTALNSMESSGCSSAIEARGVAAPTCRLRTKASGSAVVTTLEEASRFADIEEFELHNVKLGQVATVHVGNLYAGCSHAFRKMRLENCALSDQFFAVSTERLAQNGVHLTHFAMHNCVQLSMTSLISMSTLFSTSLVTLELASCKLARQAGIILSQSLQSCTTLRRLLLADNNLRDGGLRAIIDALKVSPGVCGAHSTRDESEPPYRANEATRLDELDISRNGISSAGFSALSQVSIRHVHAAGNAIESIGPFLFANLATESLDLTDNALSDDGVHELVSTLFREQTSLRELDLRGCGLSEQSVKFLCAAVQQSSCCPLWKLLLDLPVAFDSTTEAEPSVSHLLLKEMINAAAAKYPQFQIIVDVSPQETHNCNSNLNTPKSKRNSTISPAKCFARALEATAALGIVEIPPHEHGSADSIIHLAQPTPATTDTRGASKEQLVAAMAPAGDGDHFHHTRAPVLGPQLQHVDVEYIVSKTIECMNRNFEQRLGQFLAKMETQQHDKNASQVQFLAAKVDACERAIPRLEARLDTLSDRMTASQTQLSKLQNDFQMQLQQMQQEIAAVRASSMAATTHHAPSFNAPLTATTPLSIVMHNQVDELVTLKVRASEQVARNEIQKLRRETNPQTIVDAVSGHLAQFKQEVDANQSNVLCRFTESLAKDSIRLDERMLKMETQLGHLDSVIQAEQQASLLALEAISDAFTGNNNNPEGSSTSSSYSSSVTGPPTPRTAYTNSSLSSSSRQHQQSASRRR